MPPSNLPHGEHVDVFIVDAKPSDYAQFAASCAGDRFSFQFARCATDALRLRQTSPRVVWLINVELPDMSSYDLYETLRARGRKSTVCLVGDEYRADDEIQSRSCGAAMYACKPAQTAWLAPWSLLAVFGDGHSQQRSSDLQTQI